MIDPRVVEAARLLDRNEVVREKMGRNLKEYMETLQPVSLDPTVLAEFTRRMVDEVIPKIVADIEDNARAAARLRFRTPAAPTSDEQVEAVAAERERCAKVVENFFSPNAGAERVYAEEIASEIRAIAAGRGGHG